MARVASRHHAIVRKALKRYHGNEIDNAGDGFFAAFDDQADAIRCACEISDGVKVLGIEVRAGCHVGQAEVVGRKLGGVTVHAGARVMSEAQPGEVLVSGVMKDLVPASGFTFEDRGVHTLKGIDGEWRLFALTAVDGNPRPQPVGPDEAQRVREKIAPPPIVQRRAGRLGIAALAVVVAVVTVATYLVFGPSPAAPPIAVTPRSLAAIDPNSNQIVADVLLQVDPASSQITYVPPNEVWVMGRAEQVIARVDVNTRAALPPAGGFGGQVTNSARFAGEGVVYGFGSVWACGLANRVDELAISGTVDGSVRVPGPPDLLARGFGRIWVASYGRARVYGFDPNAPAELVTARVGSDFSGIAAGEGAVWVSNGGDGLSMINPKTGRAKTIHIWFKRNEGGLPVTVEGFASGVGIGYGSVWVADTENGYIHQIDPIARRVIHSYPIAGRVQESIGDYLSTVIAADGSLWVTEPSDRTIVRVDPVQGTVLATIPVPFTPRSLAFAGGDVWVTVGSS